MFKHAVLFAISYLAISCGESKQSSEKASPADSASAVSKLDQQPDTSASGQSPKRIAFKDEVKGLPATITQFVPEGFAVLDTTSGDLNLDQYTDMILVLRKNGEDSTSSVSEHPEKRPLLILTGQSDNSYKLAASNNNAVYCIDCGGMMGDPFMGIVIKNGYFSVEHYGGSGWRWTRTITFKYSGDDNHWYLHKDGGDSFQVTDPEKVTTKVRTTKDFGKVLFEQFDIYEKE